MNALSSLPRRAWDTCRGVPRGHWVEGSGLLLALALLGRGLQHFWGFVQDDAFISLRYARHLIAGQGLVFNVGERVEGFTNLGWTLLGALLEAAGADTILGWQLVGCAAAFAMVLLGHAAGRAVHGALGGVAVALVIASSSTLQCWSVSALETTPFAALLLGAAWAFGHGKPRLCFLLLGIAQWLRPEAAFAVLTTLYVGIAARPQEPIRIGRRVMHGLRGLWIYGALALPVFAFRLAYYGEWVPNTYLVKGGSGWQSHQLGLVRMFQLADEASHWWLWLAVGCLLLPSLDSSGGRGEARAARWARAALRDGLPCIVVALALTWLQLYVIDAGYLAESWSVAEAAERHEHAWYNFALFSMLGTLALRALLRPPAPLVGRRLLAWAALFWVGYIYYYIRIGGDAMVLHRLLLTAAPYSALLAVAGAARLVPVAPLVAAALRFVWRRLSLDEVRGALFAVAASWILVPTLSRVRFADSQQAMVGVSSALENCHGRVGRILQKTAKIHDFEPLVLAQDMGYLTVNAPDVRFFDTVGLVTRSVAEILYEYRYSPYWKYLVWHSTEEQRRLRAMEMRLQELYSKEVEPDYVVANVDLQVDNHEEVEQAQRELKGQNAAYWRALSGRSDMFYHWPRTNEFRQNYRFVKAFAYSTVSYLVLWRRQGAPVPALEKDTLTTQRQ